MSPSIGIITGLQYRILKWISGGGTDRDGSSPYKGKSKLQILLGEGLFERIAGKVVIDFGCGEGGDTVEIAERGAKRAIGVDIREDVLNAGRRNALTAGVQDICAFTSRPNELADIIVSVDAFEHFFDPAEILRLMDALLRPAGAVLVSFGPTWYHPLGGHLFSVFPWAHLIFSEKALVLWRSTFKDDGATRFCEVAGGLNKMTIARFEKLIVTSPLCVANFELVPIKSLRLFHNRFTREFTTSVVRCRLVKRV